MDGYNLTNQFSKILSIMSTFSFRKQKIMSTILFCTSKQKIMLTIWKFKLFSHKNSYISNISHTNKM